MPINSLAESQVTCLHKTHQWARWKTCQIRSKGDPNIYTHDEE